MLGGTSLGLGLEGTCLGVAWRALRGFERLQEASLGLREGERHHRQRLDRESSDRLQRESD